MSSSTHHQYDLFPTNPLDDPIVRSTLEKIKMTDRDLINATVKDLNKRLTGCSHATINRLKRCRRTLKNRGYAKNCRIKRLYLRNELERANAHLKAQVDELKTMNKLLQCQIDDLQRFQLKQNRPVEPKSSSFQRITRHNTNQDSYYNNHSSQQQHQQQCLALEQQQPQQQQLRQSYNYGSPTIIHDDDQLYTNNQYIHSDCSNNSSPVSSSSSSCFNADYGSIDTDSNLGCTDGQEFFATLDRGAQPVVNQSVQLTNNHISYY
jgi:hypothetical protein